jgi:hypothetical protein
MAAAVTAAAAAVAVAAVLKRQHEAHLRARDGCEQVRRRESVAEMQVSYIWHMCT